MFIKNPNSITRVIFYSYDSRGLCNSPTIHLDLGKSQRDCFFVINVANNVKCSLIVDLNANNAICNVRIDLKRHGWIPGGFADELVVIIKFKML